MTELPNDQHITYQLQYRKCGKAACSTCRDGHGHGPYWYAYWRDGARLRSGYIGKATPPAIAAQTDTPPEVPSSDVATEGFVAVAVAASA